MNPLRWAIAGPGRIAHRFAQAVAALPDAQLVAVQGRDGAHAQAFAQQYSTPGQAPVGVFANLENLLAQDDVDAVYVATPHALELRRRTSRRIAFCSFGVMLAIEYSVRLARGARH